MTPNLFERLVNAYVSDRKAVLAEAATEAGTDARWNAVLASEDAEAELLAAKDAARAVLGLSKASKVFREAKAKASERL